MKKNMLGELIVKIVDFSPETLRVLYDLAEKLSGEANQEWLVELKKFLRREKCWRNTILEFISTVSIPVTEKEFVARDNFIVNTNKEAKVKISHLDEGFRSRFLNKIEKAITKGTFYCYAKLKASSIEESIIASIGDKEEAETFLVWMFSLLRLQPNGEVGTLLTNGCLNIFYIRDVNGIVGVVHCHWDGEGWRVYASSGKSSSGWYGFHQVFFRDLL